MSPSPLTPILLLLSLLHVASSAAPHLPATAACRDTCGTLSVHYPFGTDFGCGHPDFSRYIKCTSNTLQFSTASGVYTVSSIDYPSNTIIITDPFMSTCSSMQNSGSFSLDKTSPFTITQDNIFVLLGCSGTSPVFDPYEDLCKTGSATRVCRGMYSCKGVMGIGLQQNAPISTCCVYESPNAFGSGYELDIPKLQCSSYTSVYGFGGKEGDPMKWKYGVLLQYNHTYRSNDACENCESSGGLCGFNAFDGSFSCICNNGLNSTNNCFGRGYAWSGTWVPKVTQRVTINVIGLWLLWMIPPFI